VCGTDETREHLLEEGVSEIIFVIPNPLALSGIFYNTIDYRVIEALRRHRLDGRVKRGSVLSEHFGGQL
jgi:hypothetical protein